MKQIILTFSLLLFGSCSKRQTDNAELISIESKKIDSINAERQKINDRIFLKNQQNIFKDLSGKHQLKFSSDEISPFSGTVNFEKTGRDLYHLSGTIKSGKNTLTIDGEIKKVSEKHLNFEGEIIQNIKGVIFKRTKKTTFFDEGKGTFWRLQNKVNGSGFVDYIDIHF